MDERVCQYKFFRKIKKGRSRRLSLPCVLLTMKPVNDKLFPGPRCGLKAREHCVSDRSVFRFCPEGDEGMNILHLKYAVSIADCGSINSSHQSTAKQLLYHADKEMISRGCRAWRI